MDAALAVGDVDAVRRLLTASKPTTVASEPAKPQLDPLTASADAAANKLLSQGLDILERAVASTHKEVHTMAQKTIELHELGLELVDRPVMGQAIWPAALALCRWLSDRPERCRHAHVLEVGAGSGAPGLVCLRLGAASLALTDADDELLPLMQANCALNAREPNAAARCSVRELDWRQSEHVAAARAARPGGYSLLLAADVTFGVGDFEPLMRAAAALLGRSHHARLLLARSAWFEDLQHTLLVVAEAAGLCLVAACDVELGGLSDDVVAPACVLELRWSDAELGGGLGGVR